MTTVTTNARMAAIRLSERVRQDPDLAKKLGIRVDFQNRNSSNDLYSKIRKGVDHA